MMDQYAREVEDFRFIPLKEEWGKDFRNDDKNQILNSKETHNSQRRLRVTIGINGWLTSKNDVTKPWRSVGFDTEVFALRYEMKSLLALGNSLENFVTSYAWKYVKAEIIRRTALATLWAALWPLSLLSLASTVDNPFNLARNRSDKAGRILADALINRAQGERPVTLVGYSLGARVVYACLQELAARKAFGLVESAVLIGAPIPSNRAHFQILRSVVSGRIFNVYSENDYILAFIYRATSMQLGIAGLQEIKDVEGVENLDLSKSVKGHLRYPELTAKILARCGFPDTVGGEGEIEPDANEEIKLEDLKLKDKIGTEEPNLLDFDDAPPPEPVQVRSSGRPARPIPLVAESEPLIQPRRPSAVPKRKSADARPADPRIASNTSQASLAKESLASTPPDRPAASEKSQTEDDDGEEEHLPAVQMMDHEEGDGHLGEMVTYDAPLPMED
jgi:hypothetical protein